MKTIKKYFLLDISLLIVALILCSSAGNSGTISSSGSPGGTVSDIDGNEYPTVVIGNQVWMAQNLRTTKFNDGTEIPNATAGWNALTTPGYCWYSNDPANGEIYGALYNWYTVETDKLCPDGWHVPSHSEFQQLLIFVHGNAASNNIAGGRLKSTGTVEAGTGLWNAPNSGAIEYSGPDTGATDEYGFSLLPAGYRHQGGSFGSLGVDGNLWSSTGVDSSPDNAFRWFALSNQVYLRYAANGNEKQRGYSVRCIKDK